MKKLCGKKKMPLVGIIITLLMIFAGSSLAASSPPTVNGADDNATMIAITTDNHTTLAPLIAGVTNPGYTQGSTAVMASHMPTLAKSHKGWENGGLASTEIVVAADFSGTMSTANCTGCHAAPNNSGRIDNTLANGGSAPVEIVASSTSVFWNGVHDLDNLNDRPMT